VVLPLVNVPDVGRLADAPNPVVPVTSGPAHADKGSNPASTKKKTNRFAAIIC
jgi:hypothetical protein